MTEQVLPRAAVSAEACGDAVALPLAAGEERVLAGGTVPTRRAEFVTGRTSARSALRRLGLPPVAVLRDAHGGPGGRPAWSGA